MNVIKNNFIGVAFSLSVIESRDNFYQFKLKAEGVIKMTTDDGLMRSDKAEC
jgi:hypothetical protein